MRFVFIFLLFILFGCQKDVVVPQPPPPPIPSKLNIVWQAPITPDTSRYSTSPRALTEGGIAYSSNFAVPTAFVQMREADSGKFRWKFDNFILPVDGFLRNQILGLNNKVVVNSWHRTYCIDAKSGNNDWTIDVTPEGRGELFINTIGDYVYKSNYTGSKPETVSESIVRGHYLLGKWDTLLTITAEDSFNLNILPPTLWVNPQGDSILIIRDEGLRHVLATPYEGRYNLVNLYAWNMRTRQFMWSIKDFQDERSIDINKLVVDGNQLYLHSAHELYCVNLLDGSLIWKKHFAEEIYFGNLLLHNNTIIVHGDDHGIWGVSKTDGHQIWYNNNSIGTVVNMVYFDGVVYYVSSGSPLLYAIDAETGATIWAEYSPTNKNDAYFSYSDVVIDPVRRLLYTADGYYMMCIKLPEH